MKYIKVFYLIALLSQITSCQNTQKKEIREQTNKEITYYKSKTMKNSQDIYSLSKEISRFEKEYHYGAYIYTNNCSFEILINDLPIVNHFMSSNATLKGSYYPLNWHISKKGVQNITIKMYPGFNQDTNAFNQILENNSAIQIKIVKSFLDNNNTMTDEQEVITYSTPQNKVNGTLVSVFSGKAFYEDSFTFISEVPYEIKTLEDSEILFTKNIEKLKQLEKQVVTKYNEIREIYMLGTKDELANINYNKEKRIAQQLYLSSAEIKDRWDNDYQFRTDQNLDFFDLKPIEKFTVKFYANGKIVCLQKINNKKSALWGGFKRKDKKEVTTTYIPLYLYRSKGSNDLSVY
ncbi:hypothetical protein [Flavobacterium sp. CF136]|uniref:hypothetical protein n=1 Tax=Flavobacterium sp. (strain CF136) TaxID=1144313 RepID=UPI0002718DB6|nr:hypothetical protein [Flavobacterium sp. CF136]EJL66534.1 hypothetical protein PMI10_00583 [Flavobacterium sp. CF136]